ncbi:MAG: kinA 1 [Candidatus Saccharibacteria bacterium]|nr:kinA 1 [Candidatus Saccharibacteria bacterium]
MPSCTYNKLMKTSVRPFLQNLYLLFIKPQGSDADSRRREFILNTLLCGLLVIASIALLFTLFDFFVIHIGHRIDSVWHTFVFWLAVLALLAVSRRGKPRVAAFIFIGFLFLSAVQFALAWGFRLAQAELVFALVIVIAGVLLTAPLALVASLVVAAALLVITFIQIRGIQVPLTDWEQQQYHYVDAVGYIAIFIVIGLVSWLSNREADRSLKRARRSEADLQKERDNLEAKVIERTHELEELQLARLLEMQPFAEFGRIGASLVHEIANPLTAASLHLEELNRQQHSELVRQVQRNLHHLERYLVAARKQIKRESDLRVFSVGSELRQVAHLLTHRARKAGVRVVVEKTANIKLYGDVVKFNQLTANLLANAVEASDKVASPARPEVVVRAYTKDRDTVITITDHGVGISPQNIDRLFEPFYSTKSSVRSGLGLGLSLTKQYVEHDFRGSINVASNPETGTVFTLRLRGQERP